LSASKYKLDESKQYVAIMVNDNGIRINQKYASKAFWPFQRLHKIECVAGSGDGLTICKRIVEDIAGGSLMAKGIKM
jgi:light-regulated signal transduction histidine kinase (bacteriophytochrome)